MGRGRSGDNRGKHDRLSAGAKSDRRRSLLRAYNKSNTMALIYLANISTSQLV